MQQERIRLLQYVGTPESNNFKFVWVIARNLDVSNAISIREQGNLCSPRLAPAVFQDEDYEFLGEADIDSRTMQYVFQGHVHIVDKNLLYLEVKSNSWKIFFHNEETISKAASVKMQRRIYIRVNSSPKSTYSSSNDVVVHVQVPTYKANNSRRPE
ncbi:hypothetical protein OESDEN_20799 [Oesophagostomum dentatum]|uniref:Uncharacterized protein n=1 Tax=Oesophagostomum dentatum TaxID=61180 RepID=A0A0B1S6N4_OESDE|nr:hypothetical protein OESDEN_20799 [Oesophagostomum dentatum]